MSALQYAFWDDACAEALSDANLLSAMARFEGALALASARAGVVPDAAARAIAEVAASAMFDAAALAPAARRASTLAIPFVKELTSQVARKSADAARYVHFGATSQDAIDTGVVLCLVAGSARALALSRRLGDAAAALARRHALTPTAARTLLQPAVPVPFGWKAAVWLSMLARSHAHFRAAASKACVLQFGGAAGTLSAYAGKGDDIADALAAELGLPRSPVTWHSTRDSFARLGAEAAMLAGAAGKIGRDVSLLMQPEVGEAAEPAGAGRGGSSAMPHKRNPIGCLAALEAAQRAPGLAATLLAQLSPEHERGIGQWQSQWFTLRDLLCSAASALAAMAEVLEGLQVDAAAMRANLERSRGLVYSENVSVHLSRTLGKQAAHSLTEKLCETALREGKTLAEALRADPAGKSIDTKAFDALFDPQSCYGSSAAMIERALAEWSKSIQT
ncbi:MAG TPA: lyase family protein [Burkholderiales bacterium]|nr:lyase family protein [Burkholderiales bacterium]